MSAAASPRPLSFELDQEMLDTIGLEFNAEGVAQRFARALAGVDDRDMDGVASRVFGEYGRGWIRRSQELGNLYPDATSETLKRAIARTGVMSFPLIPQRFIEIAYLGVMSFLNLEVVQNNGQKLAYRVSPCDIHQGITRSSGSHVAARLPCRHTCLTALETLFQDLGMDVQIEQEATLPRDGYCQFAASRGQP